MIIFYQSQSLTHHSESVERYLKFSLLAAFLEAPLPLELVYLLQWRWTIPIEHGHFIVIDTGSPPEVHTMVRIHLHCCECQLERRHLASHYESAI